MEELIEYIRSIHENEHKIWFTFEEIEKIINEFNESKNEDGGF